MDFRLVVSEKHLLRVEIIHPDDTLIYPLIGALLRDDDVAEAQYVTGHPQLDKPVLLVKTKKSKPQAALKRAAESLASEFAGAKKLLEKELK